MSKMGFISIHAPLAGRDGWKHRYPRKADRFQSTRPLRGATQKAQDVIDGKGDISIHAPLAGRDSAKILSDLAVGGISIHAPLAGRDALSPQMRRVPFLNFNPRAPCGARPRVRNTVFPKSEFQSTRPLRGATTPGRAAVGTPINFNPRAPCGARRFSRYA